MRAKFKCSSVTNMANGTHKYQEVKLNAVYAGELNKEDNEFAKATPSGSLTMSVSNPAALDYFKPDKDYYMDFSEAPSGDAKQ